MPDPTIAEKAEQWEAVGEQLFAGFTKAWVQSDISRALVTIAADVIGGVLGVGVAAMAPVGIGLAKGIATAENVVAPALSDMAVAAVNDMFDTKLPGNTFDGGITGGGRGGTSQHLAAAILKQLIGDGKNLEPNDEAATRYLGVVVNMALEGWYQKWFFEFLTSLIPQLDIGKIENFGSLDDKMAQALGLGRLTRRVLGPLIDANIVTPLERKVNKDTRPTLLSAAACARQIARHPNDRDRWLEDLRRQGYSDQRIDALLNEQRKFLSTSDVSLLVYRDEWSHDQALRYLQDAGYDEATAEDMLRADGKARIAQLESSEASVIVTAYAQRDIDRPTFRSALNAAVHVSAERAFLEELGELRRAMNVKHLSAAQAAACVKAGVLSFVDYRRALEREGYDDQAVTALELLLRKDLDDQKAIETHRAELAAEKAAATQAHEAELAAKRAAAEQARALAGRGREADLEKAVVRGVVPIARLEEVYAAHYDPDTIGVLVALVEQDRQAYLEQQQARDAAAQRGKARGIDVGALEQAVLEGAITLDEFRGRLSGLGFDAGDAEILTATLARKKATRDAAEQKRSDATTAAAKRSINLSIVETLVRRGHRTIAYYAQLLEGLGFDQAAIADMTELLQLKIADDQAARELRDQISRVPQPRDLSLEQARRAVLLELQDLDWFQRYLFEQQYTTDAQRVLLAELRTDVDEAKAARNRRDGGDRQVDASRLPLSVAARAARLGVISPAAYQERLIAAGYTSDDVDVEMDLLVLEIADVQTQRAKRDQAPAPATPRELSLADVERAVKAGQASIGDYVTRAITLGYSSADAKLLAAVVAQELETLTAARKRHEQIAFELAAGGVALGAIEDQVKAGTLTLEGYAAQLEALGYAAADAELLINLLLFNLGGPTHG